MIPRAHLEVAVRAAVLGGRAAMVEYGSGIRHDIKDDDSPVTAADLSSNEIIKSTLAKTRIPILSEEDADIPERIGAPTVWIVDPLDGTADFIDGTGEFTVMVALVSGNVPVLGVINQPTTGVTYAAEHGGGAWKSDGGRWNRITTEPAAVADCMAVVSRNHQTVEERSFLESLCLGDIRSVGSSLKVAHICEGRAHIYATFTTHMKEWDTAASHIIIHEAGGKMTDMLGNPLVYNRSDVFHRNGILATNGVVHDYVVGRYVSTAGPGISKSPEPSRS